MCGPGEKEALMTGMRNDDSRFVNAITLAGRPRGLVVLTAVAGMLTLGAGTVLHARAGSPPPQQSGRLTIEDIGDALTSMGKNTVNNNGQVYYTVNSGRQDVQSNAIVSLSPNGNVIWMTTDLAVMPEAGNTSTTALFNLLKKNTDIGPLFFSINGRHLRLSSPVPNHGMNSGLVRDFLQQLIDTAADTKALWDPGTLAKGRGDTGTF